METKTALQVHHESYCDEMLRITAEVGYKYVSIAFGSGVTLQPVDWADEIVRIKKLLDSLGLVCVMTHAPYYDLRISAEITNENMERALLRCVEATAMLGAEIAAIHPRGYYAGGVEQTEKSYEINVKNIAPLVKKAGICGCLIGIENLPTFPGWDMTFYSNIPQEHKRLIDSLSRDSVCGVWDFGHSFLANEDPSAALKLLGSRIRGTHVHDNNRKNDDHLPPYFGSINWKTEIEALKQTGYTGYLTMELEYQSRINERDFIREYFKTAHDNCNKLSAMLCD